MTEAYQAPSGAEHPITPPPELVEQWWDGTHGAYYKFAAVALQAARWGADQELEAVCDEILHCVAGIYEDQVSDWSELVGLLRDSRRPKPPSLKAQALAVIENSAICDRLTPEHGAIIRRALESLPD